MWKSVSFLQFNDCLQGSGCLSFPLPEQMKFGLQKKKKKQGVCLFIEEKMFHKYQDKKISARMEQYIQMNELIYFFGTSVVNAVSMLYKWILTH